MMSAGFLVMSAMALDGLWASLARTQRLLRPTTRYMPHSTAPGCSPPGLPGIQARPRESLHTYRYLAANWLSGDLIAVRHLSARERGQLRGRGQQSYEYEASCAGFCPKQMRGKARGLVAWCL